jgi:hypothetical protein
VVIRVVVDPGGVNIFMALKNEYTNLHVMACVTAVGFWAVDT